MIADLFYNWDVAAHKFANLSKVITMAHARALISLYVVAPDYPADIQFIDLDAETEEQRDD